MQARNKHEIALSNDAAMAVQQRRIWNRCPKLAGAIWFCVASLAGYGAYFIGQGRFDSELVQTIAALVFGTTVAGGFIGPSIGSSGRSWPQLVKSVTLAAVAAFIGLLLARMILLLLSPVIASHSVGSFIWRSVSDCIAASHYVGWAIYSVPMLAGLHLYWLRSKVPPAPKVLGCGRSEHVVQIAAKEVAP